MSSVWSINEGVISLRLENGESYHPSAAEIYGQRKDEQFKIGGIAYPKLDIGIRLSSIVLCTSYSFRQENGRIVIEVFAVHARGLIRVRWLDGVPLRYVIADNVWYSLGGDIDQFAVIVARYQSNGLAFAEYLSMRREMIDVGIEFSDITDVALSSEATHAFFADNIKATLYPYQEHGSQWLAFMCANRCGCILADEMGLGKTLQVIAVISSIKNVKGNARALIVAPVSLLENWRREFSKFYPCITVHIHHGSRRPGYYKDVEQFDVTVVSYGNAQSDLSLLNMISWDLVVLDEAQNIKNPKAQRTIDIKRLHRSACIAVTGTPFENHMTDIWSLVDFAIPGYLGTLSQFQQHFNDSIESARQVEKLLTPLMLRRLVREVGSDLPDRVDIPIAIKMTDSEASMYESKRKNFSAHNMKSLRLDLIQGLRMFCTHPIVFDDDARGKDPYLLSLKYQRLCEILEEVFARGEKAIIFTSFNEMSNILCADLATRFKIVTGAINGSTPVEDRQRIIDGFSAIKGSSVLVLNPKAAGTGLNITCANHVIHYNLEWNPAIEDQASARAYRRGQSRNVFVYRLFYSGTIEEVINERIALKRSLMKESVVGITGDSDEDYVLKALTISPYGDDQTEELDHGL